MPKFLITTKSRTLCNGIRIEPGFDIKKAGICSPVNLDVKNI